MHRKENANLAARKLGQKDLTRPKSEEDSSSTVKPDAVSPEMENMKFSDYQYMEKICQCIKKKLGRTSINATFSVDSFKNNVLAWGKFMTSSMKAAIHLGPDFLENSEVCKNTRVENIENVFNISQKLLREHSEEILNVKILAYQSPSWTRSTLFNDNMIKWATAKVCVYADSVLCVGKKEQNPGVADEKWTGQVEDLKRYPSYQDAVGIDGEATEFEWKKFPGFNTLTILKGIHMDLERKNNKLENFKDRIILMSMFNDIEWRKNDENCVPNARIMQRGFYQDIGLFCVQVRRTDGTVVLKMDNGTVQDSLHSSTR